jgi:lipoate-protein ligase A
VSSSRTLRVLDLGTVDALRSQTTWHALGHVAPVPGEVTLSFVRSSEPYVCLGRHRPLDEVDADVLARHGLPVFRRMVGGGPVYLDADQLFFQVSLPAADVPARRDRALADLLAPAAAALRRCGVDARLDPSGEISVGPAKVCGHGAGQLEDMVVVVGNLILEFDHDRAAEVLRTSSPATTAEVARLMRRYVHPTPVDPDEWREAMVAEYSAALGATVRAGRMRADERDEQRRLDALLGSAEWVGSVVRPARDVRTLKIRAGVWVHEWAHADGCVVLSVADGRVDNVVAVGAGAPPDGLLGAPVDRARDLLSDNDIGRLAAALAAVPTGGIST